MAALPQTFVDRLVVQFRGTGVRAVALMGSYARGDAGPYSDVDLVRFTTQDAAVLPGTGSHVVADRLVVVSDAGPATVTAWFTEPERAVEVISGVRAARPLWDPDGVFTAIQDRAHAFAWDAAMQARADQWASQALVGWAEEAHKGLEGLRRDAADPGRLLGARHGLSWGLTRVMAVQRGVLLSGDNALYTETAQAVGATSVWARMQRAAFGIEGDDGTVLPLREQVHAGLRLYVLTVELLRPHLQSDDVPLIAHTVRRIEEALHTGSTEPAPRR